MKRIKKIIYVAMVLMLPLVIVAHAPVASAYDPLGTTCKDNSTSEICKDRSSSSNSISKLIGTIVNTLLYFVGALSVIMIIVAGVMYTTSAGNAGQITKAKGALTYAIVGLVVAFLAYAIVNWVFKLIKL